MSVMDFDLSKENIQPLRGGRNVTQLGMALQAQTSQEHQQQLQHQREQFETTIKHYEGEDPLEHWYQYIAWVEQSYPKHGHEGNLIPLLEDCLQKFENDARYINDQRMCKLWIKYNDLQSNPLELYHMMHARGLCRGCSDLYIAWAYYHEAAGDFRSADMIFQMGKQELAQPYQQLINAHQEMVLAAGQQAISGIGDEHRLTEQRRVLTSLRTYKPGRVGTIRLPANEPTSGLATALPSTSRSNALIPVVYEDRENAGVAHAVAAPVSILSVARKQVAPKENTIKPGTWTTSLAHCKCPAGGRAQAPQFVVHEDGAAAAVARTGLILPRDFYPVTHEDYSTWRSALFHPDPVDPARVPVPMYPKARVYPGGDIEFSMEELRARKYAGRRAAAAAAMQVSAVVEQVVEVLEDEEEEEAAIETIRGAAGDCGERVADSLQMTLKEHSYGSKPFLTPHNVPQTTLAHMSPKDQMLRQQLESEAGGAPIQFIPQQLQTTPVHNLTLTNLLKEGIKPNQRIFGQNLGESVIRPPAVVAAPPAIPIIDLSENDEHDAQEDQMNALWTSEVFDHSTLDAVDPSQLNKSSQFLIYEEPSSQPVQPRGSAMRTLPFKILSDEELAETGSRGGLDIAAAAQPCDEAKRVVIVDDDDDDDDGFNNVDDDSCSSSLPAPMQKIHVVDSSSPCNTQIFNFNLNTMQVSTPKMKSIALIGGDALTTRKQLFNREPEAKHMSTIIEERSNSTSNGSSSSTTIKSVFNHSKRETMLPVISEENKNYLAQNLKANAALRTSLYELMECESGQSSPVSESAPALGPLFTPPSDPFRPSVVKTLLSKIGFPGKHCNNYTRLYLTPRLMVRKEAVRIGEERFIIEKMLGKGTYGQVYKAVDVETKAVIALKFQKPPNCWEYYICKEIHARLGHHPLRDRFMDITTGYFNDEASVFVSEFSPLGSLLDVTKVVKQKTGRTPKESVCIFFALEMLRIVQALHQAQIIHADIKPDNFLVFVNCSGSIELQLIDFGCSIDMTLFPPGATFSRRVTTENFECCEMLDGRPWNYHTDLFCVAATTHVLLFEKYMTMERKGGPWAIKQRIQRYMRIDLWNMFFSSLLNQPEAAVDPEPLIALLEEAKMNVLDEVNREMRTLVNILENR